MIVIKDMEMPSSCYNCPFAKNERTNDYGSFCECGILEDYETINLLEYSKHPNCPLVEQEPCEDAINRQAVLGTLDNHKYSNEFCEKHHIDWSINLGMAHIAINDLPPVTPKPKTAHWIKIGDRGFGYSDTVICKCSNCGHREEFTGKFDGQKLVVNMECADNYCSNCGRQMIEPPQESENT